MTMNGKQAIVRLHCSHWYWHRESPLEFGSFSRGVIVCNDCGKRKLIEQLKDCEVLVEPWIYGEYVEDIAINLLINAEINAIYENKVVEE